MKKVKLILGFVLLAVVSVALGVGPVPSSLMTNLRECDTLEALN
jgi:hypothetical protein